MKINDSSQNCPFCSGQGISDRMVYEEESIYVVSDLHPVTLGHLLVITKEHHLSFGELDTQSLIRIKSTINWLARILCCFGSNVIVFEHGNKTQNTSGNLSVDHAHLHLIPVPSLESRLPGKKANADFLNLADYVKSASYYFYWDVLGNSAYWGNTANIESQFIRKETVFEIGKDKWDWKSNQGVSSSKEAVEQSLIVRQMLERSHRS